MQNDKKPCSWKPVSSLPSSWSHPAPKVLLPSWFHQHSLVVSREHLLLLLLGLSKWRLLTLIPFQGRAMTRNHCLLSISTYPKRMFVTEVFSMNFSKDMEEAAMSMIFSFDKGNKVKKYSHPASGKYFLTRGSLKVTTNTKSKTYKKGDFFHCPSWRGVRAWRSWGQCQSCIHLLGYGMSPLSKLNY